ncbi:MAG: Lrp/AsnC ligand binding domain-containing protein [Candidatus Eremiobacteraeota bacterium]|nr:Lrp/AsnC ligand binding domain-containing protein [Candidatus Eremiobacteraeota bacterium]
MPIHSYILVEVEPGQVRDVSRKIASIPGISRACGVTGPYDVIAILEGDSIEELGKIVTTQIQVLPGVRKTITCLCTLCSTDQV